MEVDDLISELREDFKARIIKYKKLIIWYEVFALVGGSIFGYIGHLLANSNANNVSQIHPLLVDIAGSVIIAALAPLVFITVFYLIVTIFWFPPSIAKKRGHAYTGLIQVLTIAGIFTGITWFIALAWAIFPSEKSLIDPVVGNVTGLGRRNAGDTIGSASQGMERGKKTEIKTDELIDKLIDLHTKGLISDEEFARKKTEIIQRNT